MNRLTEQFFASPASFFTQSQAAALLPGSDDSRHGLVKRALAKGEILKIKRGMYCLSPRFQRKPINSLSLAQHIYGPSYISLETALSYHGWIPEAVYTTTSVSFGNAKDFKTPMGVFSYQRVPQVEFFHGVDRCVSPAGDVFFMASAAKSLVDYFYLGRLDWATPSDASANLRIEMDHLLAVSSKELAALASNYKSHRVKGFLEAWQEETT